MKNQNWVQKCVSWIKEFLQDLKAAYANINPDFPEGELVINDKAFLDGLIERFDRAFSDGTISNNSKDDIVRHQSRDYSYENLVKKPDMNITMVGTDIPQKRSDLVWVAKNNAIKVGKSNSDGSVSVYVNDIGMDVILATKGLRHGLRRTQDVQDNANFLVTLKAGEILKNSIRINELTPSKADVNNSYI